MIGARFISRRCNFPSQEVRNLVKLNSYDVGPSVLVEAIANIFLNSRSHSLRSPISE